MQGHLAEMPGFLHGGAFVRTFPGGANEEKRRRPANNMDCQAPDFKCKNRPRNVFLSFYLFFYKKKQFSGCTTAFLD
jgi:hypothetical protein